MTLLGPSVTRTLTVPARRRVVVELGTWNVRGDFGVEVACERSCAASLVMWDAAMRTANPSVPIVGCETR